jgi:hypothetical protein
MAELIRLVTYAHQGDAKPTHDTHYRVHAVPAVGDRLWDKGEPFKVFKVKPSPSGSVLPTVRVEPDAGRVAEIRAMLPRPGYAVEVRRDAFSGRWGARVVDTRLGTWSPGSGDCGSEEEAVERAIGNIE